MEIKGQEGEAVKAVVDRFEGRHAVLLVGEEEIKMEVPRELLPGEAREGSWLKVTFELDPEETEKREQKVRGLLAKLQGDGSG